MSVLTKLQRILPISCNKYFALHLHTRAHIYTSAYMHVDLQKLNTLL